MAKSLSDGVRVLSLRSLAALFNLLWIAAGVNAANLRDVTDARGLNAALSSARPGDKIVLQPGEYRGNFYFRNVHGTAEKPIVIRAADPARPPVLLGRALCLQLSGASHVEIRDLHLSRASQNGLIIDDAEQFEKPTHHIVLKNLRVSRIGPDGNSDGIKLSGVDEFRIENCTVDRWGGNGSGIDMVGCHRGVIESCTFTRGGFNALQIKGGSSDITVRKCRFEDYGERGVNIGGFTGDEFFRPPLNRMPANRRSEARNIRIEGCTFLRGEAPFAFASADGSVCRFNTIYLPKKYAVRILQEKSGPGFVPCRDGVVQDNVIVFRSDNWSEGGVNVGPDTAPQTFRFARNLWFCVDRPQQSEPRLPSPGRNEIVGRDPLFRDAANGDFRVREGSPAADRGAHALPERK